MVKVKSEWVLASAMTVALSGCVIDDGVRTQMEGTGLGAAIGGAIGYMVGGNDGIAIGAALGGGLGFALGNNIANRKQSYASREDALDGEIAYYAEYNRNVEKANRQLAADIASLERQSNALLAKYRKGQASRSQIIAQKAAIDEAYTKNGKYLAELNEQYTEGVSYLNNELAGSGANASKIAQLRKEQKHLQNEIEKVKKLHNQMAKIEQGMSV